MLLTSRYRVMQTLGSGGFGETFLAEDTQMPSRRRCVIKLLKPITNNPQIYELVQERFGREAAILEELGGKNEQIPSLYAYFELDGQFYLVQEWIEGVTLTRLLREQGTLNEHQVREILIQILPVLEYVHQQRIVHRDIKPDNIILRKHDGKPVLIDFGAVRESMGTVVNSQGNPTSSIVIGTPGYMPSEQAAGRPMYSSDLYSLGMTIIYLLTAKTPQELETDAQSGEIIWRQFAPNLSPEFAEIIDKTIAYHPRERFATAQSLLDTLQGIMPQIAPTQYVNQNVNQHVNQHTAETRYSETLATQTNHHGTINDGRKNKAIKTGLIAGGLIAVSVAVGIALRPKDSSTSPISENSVPSNSSSNSTSLKPSASQINSNSTNPQVNAEVTPEAKSNSNSNNSTNSTNSTQTFITTTNSPTPIPESELSSPSPSAAPPITNDNDVDYSWLSQRRVNQSDLLGQDAFSLDIMRNSIYARNGFRFQTPGLQAYFNQQSWYQPIHPPASQTKPEKILSKLEIENAVFIRNYQKANNLFYFK